MEFPEVERENVYTFVSVLDLKFVVLDLIMGWVTNRDSETSKALLRNLTVIDGLLGLWCP